MPAGCILKDAVRLPLIASDMDLPSPQPGQKSTPERLNRQNVGSSKPGAIDAASRRPKASTIHSKCKKKLLFRAVMFTFMAESLFNEID